MRIALLPLDDRPVNGRLPAMVAAIAGGELLMPPVELLPRMREPSDPDALCLWTEQAAAECDSLVVSLDLIGYGGLIASRISHDTVDTVIRRLSVLTRIHEARPQLPVSAVATVMRASNSHSAGEEPQYWSDHGVELHNLGGALHRAFLGEQHELASLVREVPARFRGDFLRRRLRNHIVGLYGLTLAADGVVDPLMVTADDTAKRAAGSLEQIWLGHWKGALELDDRVYSYPGADEVCSVLVARELARAAGAIPRIAVMFPETGGEGRIAPFENAPVGRAVINQIGAAGAVVADDPAEADAVLVVHAPDPDRGDLAGGNQVKPGEAAVDVLAANLADQVAAGRVVGLADVRYVNGSDAVLIARLLKEGITGTLAAYGGWNTAGNTIGSVVAALVAQVVGRQRGTFDPRAQRRLVLHRLAEDYGYQALVRNELALLPGFGDHLAVPFEQSGSADRYLSMCEARMAEVFAGLLSPGENWQLTDVRLPWNRAFEIDFELRPSP
jgi:hypothetical protein